MSLEDLLHLPMYGNSFLYPHVYFGNVLANVLSTGIQQCGIVAVLISKDNTLRGHNNSAYSDEYKKQKGKSSPRGTWLAVFPRGAVKIKIKELSTDYSGDSSFFDRK